MATTAPAVVSRAQLEKQAQSARADAREAKAEVKALEKNYSARMSKFVREDLPQIATYAGAGAAIGGLLGYWLHDRMKEWFGADSYIGLLGTAALGVVVVIATPSLVKVSRAKIAETAPTQAALYGLGVGLVGAGAWRAYQDWPAA
jgi:hypothetical protein